MIRINLLPVRAAKKKESGRQQLVLFAGLVILGLGLNAFWWWSVDAELGLKNAQAKKLEEDIKQLERIIGEVNTISKDKKALEDKLAVLGELKAGRTGPVRLLDALASIVPAKVWMTQVEEKAGVLTIKGAAVTNEDLADFMRELKKSPFFKEPSLKKASQKEDKGGGGKFVDFELSCGFSYSA